MAASSDIEEEPEGEAVGASTHNTWIWESAVSWMTRRSEGFASRREEIVGKLAASRSGRSTDLPTGGGEVKGL